MLRRMDAPPRYWFPAKRYGWGWGPPRVWQGWAVLAAYTAALLAPVFLLPERPAVWVVVMVFGTAVLLWTCGRKGEPLAGWRWGDE